MTGRDTVVALVACEPSGDALGGRIMAALRERLDGRIRFLGVGGPAMQANGLDSLFPMDELTLFGLAELLPHLRLIWRRLRQTARVITETQPDIVVTIDAPGFNFPLARRLKGRRFPVVHVVAPTVWAWRPRRADDMATFLDHLFVLLPFEPPWFERVGLACSFIGHPVIEGDIARGDGAGFRRRHAVGPDETVLGVLPGSRRGEVSRLMPVLGETVARIAADRPGIRPVIVSTEARRPAIEAAAGAWPVPVLIVGADEKAGAFCAMDAAVAASGTVAVELATAHVPTVIAYRLNALTAFMVKRLIRVRYVNLVNLLLDREVVPEFLQENCRAEPIAAAVARLLDDPQERRRHVEGLEAGLALMRPPGGSPSTRAADLLIGLMRPRPDAPGP